jgi:hypothetical protein
MRLNTTAKDHAEPSKTIHLMGSSSITEYTGFWSSDSADDILRQLLSELTWRTDCINLFGKRIPIPRLQCWMGEPHCDYKYSGISLAPMPWVPIVARIRDKINTTSGEAFNCVLINHYRMVSTVMVGTLMTRKSSASPLPSRQQASEPLVVFNSNLKEKGQINPQQSILRMEALSL